MSTRLHCKRPAPAQARPTPRRPRSNGCAALLLILAASYALCVAAAFYGLWMAP